MQVEYALWTPLGIAGLPFFEARAFGRIAVAHARGLRLLQLNRLVKLASIFAALAAIATAT